VPRFSTRPDAYRVAFRSGQDVHTKVDPRHIGKVIAVFYGATVRVRWDNGWKSDHDASELERA
jgi:hypothetical protein